MVRDGIISQVSFDQANPKILWILKEANDPQKGNWDLREFLHNREERLFSYTSKSKKRKVALWPRTWGLVIKVSYAISEKLDSLQEINKPLKTCAPILDNIAVINIKKEGGKRRASSKELDCYLENEAHQKILVDQITNEIDPDIIICGGTFGLMRKYGIVIPNNYEKNLDWGGTHDNKIWIDAYHPNQTTIKHDDYYREIRNVISENRTIKAD